MKKLLIVLLISTLAIFSGTNYTFAQDGDSAEGTEVVDSAAIAAAAAATAAAESEVAEDEGGITILKKYFVEGGWEFMGIVLLCLILGLAFAIERILTLNLFSSNPNKLLANVEDALKAGDVEKAKDIARRTRGPVASIVYQGLDRHDQSIEAIEKSVVSYGGVQMAKLERGLTWISLFIALAPMLGFMGTVIGMIQAFDKIAEVGDISPAVVAGGIKVALLTTVFGLIVAIILQIFYNYIISKIDGIVAGMEESSVSLVDLLVRYKRKSA